MLSKTPLISSWRRPRPSRWTRFPLANANPAVRYAIDGPDTAGKGVLSWQRVTGGCRASRRVVLADRDVHGAWTSTGRRRAYTLRSASHILSTSPRPRCTARFPTA
ncbi:hypothetical protein PsYK624_101050 [Phanerochaete sordida]|uniref:Uncharacterized protein n=1 Tax=Phanerochaete sordida TaxID=48140 RepID=A0A9P3LG48_9APHY|nr:hypothetical protein PsYK624_101050 [Phanerochaete sordida]